MKKLALKLTVLCLLLAGVCSIDVEVKGSSCVDEMFSEMDSCDGSYFPAYFDYQSASNSCYSGAASACTGSSNPYCSQNYYDSCMSSPTSTYQTAASDFDSCLSGAFNSMCTAEPDFCGAAVARANACLGLEDMDAKNSCYMNSGVGICQ